MDELGWGVATGRGQECGIGYRETGTGQAVVSFGRASNWVLERRWSAWRYRRWRVCVRGVPFEELSTFAA